MTVTWFPVTIINDADNVVPHPRTPTPVVVRGSGELFITPCDVDGGSWCLIHETLSRQTLIAASFKLDDALTAGRDAARRLEVVFEEGGDR